MKKVLALFMAVLFLISATACGDNSSTEEISSSSEQESVVDESSSDFEKYEEALSTLIACIEDDVEKTVSSLVSEGEALMAKVDTYSKYKSSVSEIHSFYSKVYSETNELCIRLREYSIEMAKLILGSPGDNEDKCDDLDEIRECISEDAGDRIYEDIYDGLMRDFDKAFYRGILSEVFTTDTYDEVSKYLADEYDIHTEITTDVYKAEFDMDSDVFDFYLELRETILDDDMEEYVKEIKDFENDIAKLKAKAIKKPTSSSNSSNEEDDKAEDTQSSSSFADSSDKNNDEESYEDFVKRIDGYEAFIYEYAEYVTELESSDEDEEVLLSNFLEMTEKFIEVVDEMEKLESEDLSYDKMAYYIKTLAKISVKLEELSEKISPTE